MNGRTIRTIAAAIAMAAAASAIAQSTPSPSAVKAQITSSRDCAPVYPEKAAKTWAQGEVHIEFHVDAEGHVTGADIVESSGHDHEHTALDREAVRALSLCPFTPARDENGNPVAGVADVRYRYVLH
jgi:TonB family protein